MLVVFPAAARSIKFDRTREIEENQQTVRQTVESTAVRESCLMLPANTLVNNKGHQRSVRCCLPAAIPVSLSSFAASAARAASRLRLMVSKDRSSRLNSGCHAFLCRMHSVSDALLYSSLCHVDTFLQLCSCAHHCTTQSEICLSKAQPFLIMCPELTC